MIVVPDTGSIQLPGASAERGTKHKGGEGSEGLRGLKSLGVRDLKHRMAFLACNVICSSMKLGEQAPDSSEEASPQTIKERMSPAEWNTIYKMSQDRNLYQNLINSLFPTIHGNEEVKYFLFLVALVLKALNRFYYYFYYENNIEEVPFYTFLMAYL